MSEDPVAYTTRAREHEFVIHCIPPKATSQQKGIMMIGGKPRHFKKKNVKQAEDTFLALLAMHRPEQSFDGPISLTVMWRYPWRKSEPKKNKAYGWKPCDTRPDCSNIVKILEDCMTRLNFWTDDSQIAQLHITKAWANDPGITIHIQEIIQ